MKRRQAASSGPISFISFTPPGGPPVYPAVRPTPESHEPRPVHVRDADGKLKYNRLVDDGREVLFFVNPGGFLTRADLLREGWTLQPGHPDREFAEYMIRQDGAHGFTCSPTVRAQFESMMAGCFCKLCSPRF